MPFEGDVPKPVLLVGENGSGKSIVLSHIVNGLISAKSIAFPDSPEVEPGRVYKLRSASYVKSGSKYYFARVDFQNDLYVAEIQALSKKREHDDVPSGIDESDARPVWRKMLPDENEHFDSNLSLPDNEQDVRNMFGQGCVLYFPPNRFEEPAWLNESNLIAKAQYMDMERMADRTSRNVINYSPLHGNQNWLFELIYDMNAFELQTRQSVSADSNNRLVIREAPEYSGVSTSIYSKTLEIVREITQTPDAIFGIGRRHNRTVSLRTESGQRLVPNIFQLSSGQTALLNLFISLCRDADLSGTVLSDPNEIRGVAVVDEIDLHLHSVHQYEILPKLMKMFPKVQFIVTTHSPLFVLGMNKVYREDGFAIYRMPEGHQISPEEFSEFGNAYLAFTETSKFSKDMRKAVENAQRPIAIPEGKTDKKYIRKAAELLGRQAILDDIDLWDGGGEGQLTKIWKNFTPPLPDLLPQEVMLLYDCDVGKEPDRKGNLIRRILPLQNSPVDKGIENLFTRGTLKRAKEYKPEFIDIEEGHCITERGCTRDVPEKWTVNTNEKTNLCNWLCENGSQEDFQGFDVVFELLEELLEEDSEQIEVNTETEN